MTHQDSLRFELAAPSDAAGTLALYTAVKASGTSQWSEDYPGAGTIAEDLATDGLYVLRDGEGIIAAVSLLAGDDHDREPLDWTPVRSCALSRLCVSPERQGEGLGRLMVERLLEAARFRGYESVRLLCDTRNQAADRLYKRLDFRYTGDTHLYGHDYRAYEFLL